MRSFNSIEAFGSFLRALAVQAEDQAAAALREGAHIVAEDAKGRLGQYDGNDWPQLAQSTQDRRSAAGYAPNNPLLVTGALHDAITSSGQGHEAAAGVPDARGDDGTSLGDIAVWQEMGTAAAKHPIPPRPFLAPAGFAQAEKVAEMVAKAAADALMGKG